MSSPDDRQAGTAKPGGLWRRVGPARLLLLGLFLPARLWGDLGLFDTHLHYDAEHARVLSPVQVVEILDRNAVDRALVTGTPPEAAATLHALAPQRILPLLGVYRAEGHKQDWYRDPALPARVAAQLDGGPWRGIGELHIFAEQRTQPVFLRLLELAAERRLPVLLHSDPAVVDEVFRAVPQVTVIWAHAGAYPYPPLIRDYLARYQNLYVDLSVRDERIAPGGRLDPEWEVLLMTHEERFLIGVDTYSVDRWRAFGEVTQRIRGWLGQLPDGVAESIAWRNAQRLFPDAD